MHIPALIRYKFIPARKVREKAIKFCTLRKLAALGRPTGRDGGKNGSTSANSATVRWVA